MLYYLVVTLYVLVCALLIITILLQQGKGGDIAQAFGGGSSQAVFGARSGATLLTRATSVLAASVRDRRAHAGSLGHPWHQLGRRWHRRSSASGAGQRDPGSCGSGDTAAGQLDAVRI